MTLPNLTSPTAELIAYRDELRMKVAGIQMQIYDLENNMDHWQSLAIEVLDELNRRESCPHEDFTENLEGRKCRECGLETK